ncbi:MAG TPA: MerR family transcriptional regulator [Acidothermaceae bacterium]|nr:MerR family transcriptional regulator [Acidothermaceae bacterium]
MTQTTTYTVGEAAVRSGFSVDTLRYYERLGLLEPVDRSAGQQRRYREADLDWLGFVSCLRGTGMPVREMREVAELVREGDHTIPQRIAVLEAHADRVRQRIRELTEQLDAVDHKVAYYRGVLADSTTGKDR